MVPYQHELLSAVDQRHKTRDLIRLSSFVHYHSGKGVVFQIFRGGTHTSGTYTNLIIVTLRLALIFFWLNRILRWWHFEHRRWKYVWRNFYMSFHRNIHFSRRFRARLTYKYPDSYGSDSRFLKFIVQKINCNVTFGTSQYGCRGLS